jgi:hypothetical protein
MKAIKRHNIKALASKVLILTLALSGLVTVLKPAQVSAIQITSRSLTLKNNATAPNGGSQAGAASNHLFSFTLPAGADTTVGSVRFTYCSSATGFGSCTPTGLVTTSATLGSQTGLSGFTLNNTTNAAPYITHGTPQTISTPLAITVQLDNVTNPSTANQTFWVQIEAYSTSSPGAIGSGTDQGIVAASTANQISVSGTMPESLVFCTGVTVNATCSSVTGTSVALGTFSPTATNSGTSQMAASSNAGSGYSITYTGDTLKSGANSITAMAGGASAIGTSQFGINVVDNATPNVGANVNPAADGTNYKGQGATGYDTADSFKFVATTAANSVGDTLANSSNGGAGPSDAQVFTKSYIVNVRGNQAAGTYTTTLTYVCTATF